jgi:hypothetical protein
MKTLSLIFKNGASSQLRKFYGKETTCYYLLEDYQFFVSLKLLLGKDIQLRTLSELFDTTLQGLIKPYQELIAELNQESGSVYWWGHHLASKSSSALPLFRNIVYLFCCEILLSQAVSDLVFVIDSPALGRSIGEIAGTKGWKVHAQTKPVSDKLNRLVCMGKGIIGSLRFLMRACQKKYLGSKPVPSLFDENNSFKKRVVFRSWVNQDNFHLDTGVFSDRNFGCLPDVYRARSYEVWTMPMFFNLKTSLHKLLKLMGGGGNQFLIPEQYLTVSDFFCGLFQSYKISRIRYLQRYLNGVDIAPLINEVLDRQGIDTSLCELNLCYFSLKKLKEKGFEVAVFLYPFENNASEKLFILGCQEHYPDAKLIGFQHSAFYPNNMAFHLGCTEADFHPLPAKIVCSGPIYQQLLEEAGFPASKLVPGQNLRFESANQVSNAHVYTKAKERKKILLTLSFSYDQAFELFLKMKEVLSSSRHYEVFIRNHPLLSNGKIADFLDLIEFGPYQLAEGGTIQDWGVQMYAFILAGASITSVEAAAMGVPVVRLILDNSITYDALVWPEYPLTPANSIEGIQDQFEMIEILLKKDPEIFIKLGRKISVDFFTPPTEENLQVYF